MDVTINVEEDNLIDVANGLREIARLIDNGMTSGAGYNAWEINIIKE